MGERVDVAVVGGGLAGLTAAAFAARSGRSVIVLEKAAEAGGRAGSRTLDGFVFNQGAHALYRRGPGTAVLRELGIRPAGAPPARGYLAEIDGRETALPVDVRSLMTTGALRWREKVQVGRTLAALPRLDAAAYDSVTVDAWLDGLDMGGGARALVLALVRLATYVNDPQRQSAGAAIRQLQDATAGGVSYLHGGWKQLVDAVRSTATAAGAVVRTRAGVNALEAGLAGWRLETEHGPVEAGAVILAVAPAVAARLAGSETLGALPAAAHAACLDVALRRLPRADRPFLLGIDRPLYASVHSLAAQLAPAGSALVHLARYGGGADARPELEALLDRLQPGWRAEVAHARFLPDMVVTNDLVSATRGGLAGRAPVEVADKAGLYLCGDWIGEEGQLAHASLASARRAAELATALTGASRAA
jgi:phytoene dehydrogenase-like protein